jgi:ribokinase
MAVFNLGSINIDHVYRVPSLPNPGETLSAREYGRGLGGKGANQSIAAASAGAETHHIGAIGKGDEWVLEPFLRLGLDQTHIRSLDQTTGHAIIYVDAAAENCIVLHDGANHAITEDQIDGALALAKPGDWLILQNETCLVAYAAARAKANGMRVAYSAAPFVAAEVEAVSGSIDLLVLNEGEAALLEEALPAFGETHPDLAWLVTRGANGSLYRHGGEETKVPAQPAQAADTTGAGDTYLGYFIAALDAGRTIREAMTEASAAAAIQVSRHGAASAIPLRQDVDEYLRNLAPPP